MALLIGGIGGIGVVVLIGSMVIWATTSYDAAASRACDLAVTALLHSKDLVEVQRSGILIHELDCAVGRRIRNEN
jgi:hypothetical protein